MAATILAGEEDTGTAHETYNIGCDVLLEDLSELTPQLRLREPQTCHEG